MSRSDALGQLGIGAYKVPLLAIELMSHAATYI